jgi:hypothetical protein
MENWPLKIPVFPVEENVNGITIGLDVLFSVSVPDAENPAVVFSIFVDLN